MDRVRRVLNQFWGYDSFRPLQEQSIESILSGQDSLTVLPTGGGKSLCFQAPALCTDGLAVVVSPLISLMQDQVDALNQMGVRAAFINSSQNEAEKHQIAGQISSGNLQLLYLAPERLLADRMLAFLREQPVAYFAIDEAHCVSQWGHDFRPEYRELRTLKQQFPGVSIHAFTATASEPVRRDIAEQLGLANALHLVGDFDRPNLTYRMIRADQKVRQVMEVARRHRGESGIVYCISRREVELMSRALCELGLNAKPYHAGMSAPQRKESQDAFMRERCDIIVATVAFGMGIDKSNVRFVVHAGMPKSIEHYQQESGRAGRDGLEAECVLLHSARDFLTWKDIMAGQGGKTAAQALQAIFDLSNGITCRHQAIVEYFGQAYSNENCGACDVCLNELKLIEDSVVTSQKILSCVVRLRERFGAGHTAKVLVGKLEKRVVQFEHDQLSTFGLLAGYGTMAIQVWIEQLVTQRFLVRDAKYRTLALTESGRKLLHGDGSPKLTISGNSNGGATGHREDPWQGVDRKLFDLLRNLRSDVAAQRNVPAYTIFGDGTLRQMAKVRPSKLETLGSFPGIGVKKFEEFGHAFFDLIDTECSGRRLCRDASSPGEDFIPSSNSIAAFDYFRAGDSVDAVAQKMVRAKSTVIKYLADYVRYHRISDPTPWVNPEIATMVFENKTLADDGKLKPLFEHFKGQVSYDDIRITLACDA